MAFIEQLTEGCGSGFMAQQMMKIAFIGVGNIANAMINGLVSKGVLRGDLIYVYDCDEEKYKHISASGVHCCATCSDAVSAAELVVFALKPGVIFEVADSLAVSGCDFFGKTFISVAAGISTDFICSALRKNVPVIRAMPNTPLLVGEGAVALSHNSFVDDKTFCYVCRLFSAIAEIAVVKEELMNAVISVNGSSPAYIYAFYKAMLNGALAQGIPPKDASALLLQSFKGAIAMIQKSGKSIDTLINDVSSPGGTTLAALSVFDSANLSGIVSDAMLACTARAEEMSKEVGGKLQRS